jgi:hypothetical protein
MQGNIGDHICIRNRFPGRQTPALMCLPIIRENRVERKTTLSDFFKGWNSWICFGIHKPFIRRFSETRLCPGRFYDTSNQLTLKTIFIVMAYHHPNHLSRQEGKNHGTERFT